MTIVDRSKYRPSFETIYMELAWLLSERSSCTRLSVGCVITSNDFRRVLAVGYNGNATRLPNHCDSDEPGNCGDLHAEENACINCCEPRSTPKYVFVTHLPCKMCAKRLVNLGHVEMVYYSQDYRLKDSLVVFQQAHISIQSLEVVAPPMHESLIGAR